MPDKPDDKLDPDRLLNLVNRIKTILEAAEYGLPSWHRMLHEDMQELVEYYMEGKTP